MCMEYVYKNLKMIFKACMYERGSYTANRASLPYDGNKFHIKK
jgi:hypothetical protein